MFVNAFLFCFWLRFCCCYLNILLYIIYIMFRLTLKDFLSIIGSINTCVPNFSLSLSLSISLSLSPSVHTIVI